MSTKSTGIVRNLDPLGRIVIPKEIRSTFSININDPVAIYVNDNEEIILKKYEPACIFCSHTDDVVLFNGKQVCKNCIELLKQTLGEKE